MNEVGGEGGEGGVGPVHQHHLAQQQVRDRSSFYVPYQGVLVLCRQLH
jgi:hypothetical protein